MIFENIMSNIFIIMMGICVGLVLGFSLAYSGIIKDCEMMNGFRISNIAYICEVDKL